MPAIRILLRALLPIRRRGRSFTRDDRGATAIEFGLLSIPFFAIVGAIIETSLLFFAGQVLDSAVQDATRLIRTGAATGSGYTVANFRTEICDGLYNLFDCNKLRIRVTTISTFSNTSSSRTINPVNTSCTPTTTPVNDCWNVTESYSAGGTSSIVLVEVFYKWRIMINLGGLNLANQPGGTRLLAAVRVFRNEPF